MESVMMADPEAGTIAVAQEQQFLGGSHLILDKVVLENFKSYGGRHVVGPFHRVRLSACSSSRCNDMFV